MLLYNSKSFKTRKKGKEEEGGKKEEEGGKNCDQMHYDTYIKLSKNKLI